MKRVAFLVVAFLVVPTLALAAGVGKCVSQCVHDLGEEANPLCVKACKDGMATGACTYATDGCCNEYFADIDQDCAGGYILDGQECYFDSQCVSTLCDVPVGANAGVCVPAPEPTCEGCHSDHGHRGLDGISGTGDDAPNVMGDGVDAVGAGTSPKPFDDGTWGYNVNGHGANGTAAHTPVDGAGYPYLGGNAACTDCHDINDPPGTHLDGVLNSVDLKQNPNANTAHLTAAFLGASSPDYSVQLTFDNRCLLQCHSSSLRHRHSKDSDPVLGAVRFGDKGSVDDGESIAFPIDSALSTNASTSAPDYAPCISCHNPHGTSTGNNGNVTNRMVRTDWVEPAALCWVCH